MTAIRVAPVAPEQIRDYDYAHYPLGWRNHPSLKIGAPLLRVQKDRKAGRVHDPLAVSMTPIPGWHPQP